MARDGRRLAQRRDELVVHVVDLDRREAQAREPRRPAGFAHEPRERVARFAVAEATEIDPGKDDFTVTLRNAAANLAEHCAGVATARAAAYERDHAEIAREAAAVLDLLERAHPLAARVV